MGLTDSTQNNSVSCPNPEGMPCMVKSHGSTELNCVNFKAEPKYGWKIYDIPARVHFIYPLPFIVLVMNIIMSK